MGLLCIDEHLNEQPGSVKLIYYPDETTRIPANWHNDLELNYVASGILTLLEDGQVFTLGPGDVRFINSGAVHEMNNARPVLGITLVFSNGFMKRICLDAGQILFDGTPQEVFTQIEAFDGIGLKFRRLHRSQSALETSTEPGRNCRIPLPWRICASGFMGIDDKEGRSKWIIMYLR